VPLINSDLVYLFILFCFGASNGYISSLGMILASSPSLNPMIKESEKDVSGSLAGFCLTAGLAVGSMASFLVRWIETESYTVAESLRGLAKKPPDNDVRLDVQKTQYGALYS
jgi:hypothetical protein